MPSAWLNRPLASTWTESRLKTSMLAKTSPPLRSASSAERKAERRELRSCQETSGRRLPGKRQRPAGLSSGRNLRHDLNLCQIESEIKYHLDGLFLVEILVVAIGVHLQLVAIHNDLLSAVLKRRVHV